MSRFVLLVLAVSVAGCGVPSRPSTRAPATPREAIAQADSAAPPWHVRGTERPRAQRVDVVAALESRIDSVTRVDTISSRAWYDWSEYPGSSPRRVAGMVRAFAVRSGGDSLWRVLDAPALPVSFVAESPWPGAAPELVLPRAEACDAQAAIVPGWRETWVAPPATLVVGTTWRDSSSTPVCRDGIVLRTATQREFVVTGAVLRDGALRILVRRRSAGTITGSGVQFGDSVRFEGRLEGEMQLELLPAGAVIASGSGTSTLHLTMRGRRRTQELVQRSALEISAP